MERTYKIAGLTVNMDTFGFAFDRGRPYEVEYTKEPDFTIVSNWKVLQQTHPDVHEYFCEYTATGTNFFERILNYDGMLLHSSAVVVDGKAYLFTADSGTGKSTHTSLYRRVFGDERARILNDDKPVIRRENGEFVAYGTPWSGKTDLNLNLRVPIGGICLLRRGEKNVIRKMKPREALFALLGQTIRPKEPERMTKLLELINELLAQTNVWEMHCNMDPEAAIVSYETMSGIRKEDAE